MHILTHLLYSLLISFETSSTVKIFSSQFVRKVNYEIDAMGEPVHLLEKTIA